MVAPSPDVHSKRNEPVGPLVGIVLIVLLFLIGGAYFLIKEHAERSTVPQSERAAI